MFTELQLHFLKFKLKAFLSSIEVIDIRKSIDTIFCTVIEYRRIESIDIKVSPITSLQF